jgi:hypothetical protein
MFYPGSLNFSSRGKKTKNQAFSSSLWFKEQVLFAENKRTRILKKISPKTYRYPVDPRYGIRDPEKIHPGSAKN